MSETTFGHKAEAPKNLNFALILCSTSRYKKLKTTNSYDDPSGDLIVKTLQQHGHKVTLRAILPDDKMLIRKGVEKALKTDNVDAVITCGGTGISRTDVTIEAIDTLLEKEIPGFGEMLRNLSHKKIGSAAILTRAIAGVSHGKAIFCLPGSPDAVSLGVNKLVLPEVGHILFHALR